MPAALSRATLWPASMPLTENVDALGLTPDDLASEELEERRRKERALLERRSVTFGDTNVDGGGETCLDDVARAMQDALASKDFSRRSGQAKLAAFSGADNPRRRRGGGGRGGGDDPVYLSEEQRVLLGFAGELAAYRYLQKNVRGFSDEHWVSSLGRRFLGLPAMQDDDGFDFRVPRSKGAIHYEVKAHTGDPGYVDLERSQLAAAASMRNEGVNRWRVLYVCHVRNPALVTVHELPNPFSVAGAIYFRERQRQGVRLMIQMAE